MASRLAVAATVPCVMIVQVRGTVGLLRSLDYSLMGAWGPGQDRPTRPDGPARRARPAGHPQIPLMGERGGAVRQFANRVGVVAVATRGGGGRRRASEGVRGGVPRQFASSPT